MLAGPQSHGPAAARKHGFCPKRGKNNGRYLEKNSRAGTRQN